MDVVTALPYTQTSIVTTWLCPETLNTHDVALLRYTLSYQPGFEVDTNNAGSTSRTDLIPRLINGSESSDCLVDLIIPNLQVGTTYAVKVVAMGPGGVAGEVAEATAVTTTFGMSKYAESQIPLNKGCLYIRGTSK